MSTPHTPDPASAPEVLKEEVLHANRVFSVVHRQLRFPDGQTFERQIIRHPGAACVLGFVDPETVVLVHQYRDALQQTILEAPAGVLERDEDPAACAARELREETGYTAGRIEPVLRYFPTPGFVGEELHLFVAWDLKAGDAAPEADERLQPVTMPFAELQAQVRAGAILDGKTLSLVSYVTAFPPEALAAWRSA